MAEASWVADAHWLPPEQPALGPMALEVTCEVAGPGTNLRVRQSSSESGERWARYYELLASGWTESLADLKHYLEQGAEPRLPARGRTPA